MEKRVQKRYLAGMQGLEVLQGKEIIRQTLRDRCKMKIQHIR